MAELTAISSLESIQNRCSKEDRVNNIIVFLTYLLGDIMVTLKNVIAMSLMLIGMVSLFSQSEVPLSTSSCADCLRSGNRCGAGGVKNTIVDTLFVTLDQFSHACMYIAPYGDPLATFILYGTPPPSGLTDLVGDGYDFDFACNTSSRAYYSIPPFDGHAGYSLESIKFKVFQANCYGNNDSHTFPIWYDFEPYYMMLAHVQFDLPFTGSSFFPDFVQNIGVMSNDSTVGWRELDVTNAYNYAISNGWQHFQLMLFFEIVTDWDYAPDDVLLPNPNYAQYAPHFVATYNKDVSNEDSVSLPNITLNVYPNPFSENAIIKTDQHLTIVNVELYNIRGQRIDATKFIKQSTTEWKIVNDRKLPAGIYLIRCTVLDGNKERILTKKLLLN
jgi:hypothetical protein